jgi:hypothetical protein
MKTRINKLIYIIVALVLLVSSCEWTPVMWDESKAFVAFSEVSTSILEQGNSIGIVVAVTAIDDAPAITVDFDFDTLNIAAENAAFEGDQYTLLNDSKSLSFPNGWGWDTIWIDPTDNEIFTGDKKFNITLNGNSLELALGAISSHEVTLKDNEHPLAAWLGSYSVEAISYGDPGNWDELWSVTSEADPENVSNLIFTIAGGDPFIAKIDTEAMTISIEPGTNVGDIYDNGPTTMWVGDYATLDKLSPVTGTIESDGTIKIDMIAMLLTDYGDYYWDAFNTTWTKTGKKSLVKASIDHGKASRLK